MSLTRHILCGTLAGLLMSSLAAGDEPEETQPVIPERNPAVRPFAPGPFPPGQFSPGQFPPAQFQPGQAPRGQFPQGQFPPGGYAQPGAGMGAQRFPGQVPPGAAPGGPPVFPQRGPINGSPFGGPEMGSALPAPRMREASLIFIGTPPNKGIREHDIVTVIIDEKSEVTQTSRFDRQRNTLFRAELREFIRLGTSGNLRPAAQDQPKIDGQLRTQMNSFGNGRSNEGLKFRIAATVVDVRPNGVLVLEARKTIITDTGVWGYTMTGNCRTQDILANNTIISENIADLKLSKLEQGKVNDSTDRGWLTKLYDVLLPF